MALKRLLVALGGPGYLDSAMAEATRIARRSDAELLGLAVMDETPVGPFPGIPIGDPADAADLREDRRRRVAAGIEEAAARFETMLAGSGLPGRLLRSEGDAQECLVEAMKLADLTIVGIRHAFGCGTLDHAEDFLARVARASNRPILAMPEAARPVSRVLLAYDGSLVAADALRSFATLRAFDPDHVRIVSCREGDGDPESILAEGRAYLELHGHQVETSVLEGLPSAAILEHAESMDADLLVLGAVGRRGLSRLLAGDTASAMLARSEVPLLLRR